jgi:diketogulonate reductase-like aldo/keto reductase
MKRIKSRGANIPRLGSGTFRMSGGESQPVAERAITPGFCHVDIAWLMDQEGVIAIPKGGRTENQKASLEALTISLDDEDRAAIAALPKDQCFARPPFAPERDAVV